LREIVSNSACRAAFVMAVVVAGGCAPRETPGREQTGAARLSANPPPGAKAPAESRPRVVVLGDSLTAGLGLNADEAYPALLQQRLDTAGLKYHVVNAGVSGDTSAGGLSRLDWALDGDVRVLIVALGGNDALRGLPVVELRHNLSAIIERAQARGIVVILAGMEAPPNFGRSYNVEFHQVYPDLARQHSVAFLPFLLEGVAGVESLNQRDGIHPTEEGARLVADNVWAVLRPVLEERSRRK
jgi:acyl-CoA thioesterase-1